ncbi:flagellar hook-length control protein FliK [Oceanicoccus sp. KOV_DT_Chl]|uniref:flagellar hook-length control protein FliK n=1 Tax=Oceanicoccus sp. KOV_DT_Chl TaxID=1904639 RepID=UPI000C7D018C|nr:flagellar hook-length control protein FliK [Oceanicoccus sp. KOV_DT_Chl]
MTSMSLAPLIQQILPQLAPAAYSTSSTAAAAQSVEALLTQLAAAMTPSVDSLINQLIPLKASSGSPLIAAAATNSSVIEAVVLASTQLSAASGKPNNNGEPQFKVAVETGKQQLELTTRVPIPVGTRITLSIAQNNLANIISIGNQNNANTTTTGLSNSNQPLVNEPTKGMLARSTIANTTNNSLTTNNTPAQQNRATIEQGLRQVLPKQQTLKLLLPLLQQLTSNPLTPLPKEIQSQLSILLKQFPTAQQLQQPQNLKQSMHNSGVFLEAKLIQKLVQQISPNTTNTKTLNSSANTAAINQDIKALLLRLLPAIDKAQADNNPRAATTNPNPANTASTLLPPLPNSSTIPATSEEAKAPPIIPITPELPLTQLTNSDNTANSKNQNLDVVLRQLSNQLLAGLARTQMNQLETLSARQANTPDAPAPANSWTLEIPIVHGKNIDNLQLRIDQHLIDEEAEEKKQRGQQSWTVMLAFDLHSLGKMSVQLNIVGMSVAAIVWSQLEATHQTVKQEIGELRKNLEKVGVNVKKVDCQLGDPPKTTQPLYRQLVDIHT